MTADKVGEPAPPLKVDDHGLTGEQMRRKIAEEHKAALDAQQAHRVKAFKQAGLGG